jgi:hypothetical protein
LLGKKEHFNVSTDLENCTIGNEGMIARLTYTSSSDKSILCGQRSAKAQMSICFEITGGGGSLGVQASLPEF